MTDTFLWPATTKVIDSIINEITCREGMIHIPNTGQPGLRTITEAAIDLGDKVIAACEIIIALRTFGTKKSAQSNISHQDPWKYEPIIQSLRENTT